MNERVIVSLTTYNKRIDNIPIVLDTIFSQTICPDLVVVNLAFGEFIPERVQRYVDSHNIEVHFVKDTKVYKKLIPTLKRYPRDCVISIDDDFLYPKAMIVDFITVHNLYPHYPISGNSIVLYGMQCHCGCASLTKADFLGRYLEQIDDSIISNCPSDDMVYSFFSNMNEHPYIRTKAQYFNNMQSFNLVESYSSTVVRDKGVESTYNYLIRKFGKCPDNIWHYYNCGYDSIVDDIIQSYINMGRGDVRSTITYRVGEMLLKPIELVNRLVSSK